MNNYNKLIKRLLHILSIIILSTLLIYFVIVFMELNWYPIDIIMNPENKNYRAFILFEWILLNLNLVFIKFSYMADKEYNAQK